MRELVRLVLPLSVCHSIGQLVLKCLMPGVPDVYQGGESWLLTVTDPDNRQPVDFVGHADALRRLLGKTRLTFSGSSSLSAALSSDLKLDVTAKLLRFRRDHRAMLARGDYERLRARGSRASSVVAFERIEGQSHLVVAVPRLVERTTGNAGWPVGAGFWEDTKVRLPSSVSNWMHILSGEMVTGRKAWAPLSEIAKSLPWVVLYGRE
jgi:(1->4)-alpha-D-glucan 1-alpha-D-glucosylmutase